METNVSLPCRQNPEIFAILGNMSPVHDNLSLLFETYCCIYSHLHVILPVTSFSPLRHLTLYSFLFSAIIATGEEEK